MIYRFRLLPKVFLAFLLIPVSVAVFMGTYSLPGAEAAAWDQVETRLQQEVEVACSTLQYWHDLAASGQVSEEDARAAALAMVAQIRLGEDGGFWVTDRELVLLADPLEPELVNTNVRNVRGPDGKAVFADCTGICKPMGKGSTGTTGRTMVTRGRPSPGSFMPSLSSPGDGWWERQSTPTMPWAASSGSRTRPGTGPWPLCSSSSCTASSPCAAS